MHPDTIDYWSKLVTAAEGQEVAMASFKTRELMNDLQRAIDARGDRDVGDPDEQETF